MVRRGIIFAGSSLEVQLATGTSSYLEYIAHFFSWAEAALLRTMASVASVTRLASLRVDHLVYAVPGLLEDACADFARRTGVSPSPGGVHKGLGTHNALAALGGGAYLEILARDPGQPSPDRTWMAIDTVTEPCLVTWASKHADLPAAVDQARQQGYDPGNVESFSRPDPDSGEELRWDLAYNHYKQPLPGGGVVPFLISCKACV